MNYKHIPYESNNIVLIINYVSLESRSKKGRKKENSGLSAESAASPPETLKPIEKKFIDLYFFFIHPDPTLLKVTPAVERAASGLPCVQEIKLKVPSAKLLPAMSIGITFNSTRWSIALN